MLDWPEKENWKVGDDQENEEQHVVDLILSDETIDKWTELGNMTSIKGVKDIPMDKAMNLTYDLAKQNSPKAKLTFIEKDETVEYPWIIFTIESPNFKDDKTTISTLVYCPGQTGIIHKFQSSKTGSSSRRLKRKMDKVL